MYKLLHHAASALVEAHQTQEAYRVAPMGEAYVCQAHTAGAGTGRYTEQADDHRHSSVACTYSCSVLLAFAWAFVELQSSRRSDIVTSMFTTRFYPSEATSLHAHTSASTDTVCCTCNNQQSHLSPFFCCYHCFCTASPTIHRPCCRLISVTTGTSPTGIVQTVTWQCCRTQPTKQHGLTP